mgnify:CR=1 FL=1
MAVIDWLQTSEFIRGKIDLIEIINMKNKLNKKKKKNDSKSIVFRLSYLT